METTDFKKVKDVLSQKNTLTILTEYNALLSKIAEKLVYEMEQPTQLSEIMNVIKTQKKICEIAENLYECLQRDEVDVDKANGQIDALESACKEHEEQFERCNRECGEERAKGG